MNMSVANVGSGLSIPPGGMMPVEFSPAQKQVHAARQQQDAAQEPDAALPGRQVEEGETHHALRSLASDLEQVSLAFNKKLQFVVDHHSNEVTVKVIDRETDKVIKELPPKELQRLHSKLKETIGFLFDEWV